MLSEDSGQHAIETCTRKHLQLMNEGPAAAEHNSSGCGGDDVVVVVVIGPAAIASVVGVVVGVVAVCGPWP